MNPPPKDVLSFGLIPNPETDPEALKSEPAGEEIRRQQAVNAAIEHAVAQRGWKIKQPGEIDPASRPNPQRAEGIKATVQPSLIKVTRKSAPTFSASSAEYPDGTKFTNVNFRGQAETKLDLNISQLTAFASHVAGMFEEKVESLYGFGAKIVVAVMDAVEGRRRPLRVNDAPMQLDPEAFELLKKAASGQAPPSNPASPASESAGDTESSQFPPSILHEGGMIGGEATGEAPPMLGAESPGDDPLTDLGIG